MEERELLGPKPQKRRFRFGSELGVEELPSGEPRAGSPKGGQRRKRV